ncbi:MAG: ornithine cyclodeaminase family protein [Chloroflexi bacterium]|nr:ornithine cyclodeaminase family protein [Chloroflexota bacterium]
MVLILSRSEVQRILTINEAIEAVEQGFKELAAGHAQSPLRSSLKVPEYDGVVYIMPAFIGGLNALATKIVSVFMRNPRDYGLPTIIGTVQLNDYRTGAPLALMDGSWLTAARTGASSGVAAKYLARPDSSAAGVLGCGVQGRTQLMAACAVLPIRRALACDVVLGAAERFAREMSEVLSIPVEPAASAREVVESSDVILCATTSENPVVHGEWLKPGTFISSVGSHLPTVRELDGAAVKMSKLVVDSRESALAEAGDVILAIKEGAITADHISATIGEVALGILPGRTSREEITFFKSVGMAVQDASAALRVYNLAKERGVGVEVEI